MTGLRCFAAINIVLFHFSNPDWFGFLAPVVNAGYASVSFFILLSGFVLAYNYSSRARAGKLDRVRFWKARFTRLYPIYLLSLLLSWRMVPRSTAPTPTPCSGPAWCSRHCCFRAGCPLLATFLNTPAWTMSAESFFYVIFPWLASFKRPVKPWHYLPQLAVVWMLGLLPGTLYILFNPDGIPHPDRWSWGPWLQALKFTPLPHLASFVFGVILAELDELLDRAGRLRLNLGLAGFIGVFVPS